MQFNDEYIEVKIIKKKIKNMYFRFDDNLVLNVSCPWLMSERDIKRSIEGAKDSIYRLYKKLSKNNKKNKEDVYLLGNKLEYIYDKRIAFKDGKAYGPSVDAVNKYLEDHSLKVFQDRLNVWIDEFKPLPKFTLKKRKMKTRWGVNNQGSMTVTLNTLLIHKKVHLIDYVIVHELSHFKHMDHSKYFWAEVGRHFPNYKAARKELKD